MNGKRKVSKSKKSNEKQRKARTIPSIHPEVGEGYT
jgi:hypothetical protein